MSLQHAYSSQQSNHLDPHHHSTFASATVVKTQQPPVASGEIRFQVAPTSTGANHVICTTGNKDFERLIRGFPTAQCNIFETHAGQSSVPDITLPPCVTAIEQVSGEAPRLPTAPRGHVTLLSNDESRGVVVSVLDLVQRCSVLNLVLDSALLRDQDGNAVGVDHERLVELAGRDDCAVPTEAPIEALKHFVAWVEHHRHTAPSRLLPDQPLASVETAMELFDDPFDYALMRLISPEVCDENTPWLDITARPIQLLVAANLAATLGCDAYLGAVVHYLDFYARKELRHVGDTVAVARLWLEREGHKSVDSLFTPEHMSAATAWLTRAVPNARLSVN